MALDILALIISCIAALFAGTVAKLGFKEQKLRLRPYIYVDRINTNISTSTDTINAELEIKNCGLMTAKNAKISPVLSLDGIPQKQIALEKPHKAMIMPQQICKNPVQIKGGITKVLQGQVNVKIAVRIDYQSGGQQYFYKGTYTFFTKPYSWVFENGDAN